MRPIAHHFVLLLALLSGSLLFTGCAITASPVSGGLFTEVQAPLTATSNPAPEDLDDLKVGRSMATSILGLIATGDASIRTAMEDGDITEIVHVDYESTNILGFYATFTVVVYGR